MEKSDLWKQLSDSIEENANLKGNLNLIFKKVFMLEQNNKTRIFLYHAMKVDPMIGLLGLQQSLFFLRGDKEKFKLYILLILINQSTN